MKGHSNFILLLLLVDVVTAGTSAGLDVSAFLSSTVLLHPGQDPMACLVSQPGCECSSGVPRELCLQGWGIIGVVHPDFIHAFRFFCVFAGQGGIIDGYHCFHALQSQPLSPKAHDVQIAGDNNVCNSRVCLLLGWSSLGLWEMEAEPTS